jgi:hypothetical protein
MGDDMEADTILVLLLTAIPVGFVLWLGIHTRRRRGSTHAVGTSDSLPAETPKVVAQEAQKGAGIKGPGK